MVIGGIGMACALGTTPLVHARTDMQDFHAAVATPNSDFDSVSQALEALAASTGTDATQQIETILEDLKMISTYAATSDTKQLSTLIQTIANAAKDKTIDSSEKASIKSAITSLQNSSVKPDELRQMMDEVEDVVDSTTAISLIIIS